MTAQQGRSQVYDDDEVTARTHVSAEHADPSPDMEWGGMRPTQRASARRAGRGTDPVSLPGTVGLLFSQEEQPFAEFSGPDVRSRIPSGSCWGCVVVV